ncbi:hypothetical protein E2P63_00935, partial [Candidatus Bathyarchaeota archaeon]
MNTNYIIATVFIIAVISVTAFFYVYYSGQTDSQLEALLNLVDDTNYKTSLDAIPSKIVSMAP